MLIIWPPLQKEGEKLAAGHVTSGQENRCALVAQLKASAGKFPVQTFKDHFSSSAPRGSNQQQVTHSSYLSSLRHWKCIDESNKSTPVLSGSCLQSCMQCLSAASKSPAWYSRCANSANPWKESIRFVGSGESSKHLREGGGKTKS